jgi:hypothetical protein
MQHPARLLIVTLLLSLSSCSVGPGAGEPSPPAAIYVMNADGGVLERVTAEAGYDLQPAWSLDGRRLAFVRRAAVPAAGPPWWRTHQGALACQGLYADVDHQRGPHKGPRSGAS